MKLQQRSVKTAKSQETRIFQEIPTEIEHSFPSTLLGLEPE